MPDITITPGAPVAESSAVPPAVPESPGSTGVSNQDTEPTPAPLAGKEHEQYLTGREIAPEAMPLYSNFAGTMASINAPSGHVAAVYDWFEALPENLPAQEAKHSYKVTGEFTAEDQPALTSFLNAMAQAGASQSFVDQALKFYAGLNASPASSPTDTMSDAEIEKIDRDDSNAARAALSEAWGPSEYAFNIAAINRLLDSLPAERVAYLEDADETGRLRLNDPKILRQLAEEARRQTIPSLAQAVRETKKTERAILESWMRDRSSPYWRGAEAERLQARFRDLIRTNAGTEGPMPSNEDAVAAEIASIERLMRENPRAYYRDEATQARYRLLLEKRDGEGT